MSQLFYNERGRSLMSHNEEITRWRWARKTIDLPAAAAQAKADVWLLLQMYEDNTTPLEVRLNGRRLALVEPDANLAEFPQWHRLETPAGSFKSGENQIELRAVNPAMNGWILGLENGHRDPASFLSTDRGRSWQNNHMGVHGVLQGEYMIRVRSHGTDLVDPDPPPIVYEDAQNARLREAAELVPAGVRGIADPWKRLLALRSWVARAWPYRNKGQVYAPWDPWTILDWGKQNRGHGREGTIVMCVHYATLFASLAAALGYRARSVVVTEDLNTASGHFLAEVWNKDLAKWVLHDANFDSHYEDRQPLSAVDIADRNHHGQLLSKHEVAGPGKPKGPEDLLTWFSDLFASGRAFRLTGVWSANQYVSDPAAAPPNHGSIGYSEPEIVWYSPAGMDVAPMFPYHAATREYFDRAP